VARKLRLGRLLSHAGHAAAEAASTRAGKARERLMSPYTCNCGWHGRTWRSMNAHHGRKHAGYWGGKAARAMGRKIGKAQDEARKTSRGWRHAAGLIDHRGRPTEKGRTRPEIRGGPREATRGLRDAHRHDRDHQRAEAREQKAERAAARGRDGRAARLRDQAAALRGRHSDDGGHNMIPRSHPAHPSRAPQMPARQTRTAGKTRTAPARANGSRPAPARPVAPSRTPLQGRLAPAPNGTRPARTPR